MRDVNRRPKLTIVAPAAASPAEAAAIVAALEQFMRQHVPPAHSKGPRTNPWSRHALLEGTRHGGLAPSAWGDPHPWGSS